MAGTSQFTVQQVLEAGRRAEAEGKRDHAVQFYQHVISHHAGTPEAGAAQESLWRLDGRSGDQNPPLPGLRLPPAPGHGHNSGPNYGMGAGPAFANGHGGSMQTLRTALQNNGYAGAAPNGQWSPGSQPSQEPVTGPPTQLPQRRAQGGAAPKSGRAKRAVAQISTAAVHGYTTPKANRYRLGRLMATLIGYAGVIGLVAATTSLIVDLIHGAVNLPTPVAALLTTNPLFAVAMMLLACLLLLFSQMAKATFDLVGTHAAILTEIHGPDTD